jgi:hypothetical protein
MEESFTLELKKSDDKITKLSEDISSLQVLPFHPLRLPFSVILSFFTPMQHKLRNGIDDKSATTTTVSHHIDLKTEEIKGEMKFLLGMIQ